MAHIFLAPVEGLEVSHLISSSSADRENIRGPSACSLLESLSAHCPSLKPLPFSPQPQGSPYERAAVVSYIYIFVQIYIYI